MEEAHASVRRPVHVFAEADYRYGVGELRMVVEHVDWTHPQQHDGETWYEIHGMQVSDTGAVVGPRQVSVRASRLSVPRRRL